MEKSKRTHKHTRAFVYCKKNTESDRIVIGGIAYLFGTRVGAITFKMCARVRRTEEKERGIIIIRK